MNSTEFELPISKEQKKNISKILTNINGGHYIGMIVMELSVSILSASLVAGGIMSRKVIPLLIGICLKYLEFKMYNFLFSRDGTDMIYTKAYGYRCIVVDIDSVVLDETAKRSDLTGQRAERLVFVSNSLKYEFNGKKYSEDRPNLVIGKTEKLVTEGNREHLVVLQGKNNNILLTASMIDKRYFNMTIGELKEFAGIALKKGIDNIDIDEVINTTSFKKAINKGKIVSKKEKRKLGILIWKQFYKDYQGRSLKAELRRRFTAFIGTIVGVFTILGTIISHAGSLITLMYKSTSGVGYVVSWGILSVLVIQVIFYSGYLFFRNDICKRLSKTKEPRILYADIEYEGEEKKENVEHYKYKLITEYGDIIHNIYGRDDIYIHHRAQYGEVMVIVCDKMLAIYPKGYFDERI